jgi:hypothetical protein
MVRLSRLAICCSYCQLIARSRMKVRVPRSEDLYNQRGEKEAPIECMIRQACGVSMSQRIREVVIKWT